MKEKILEFLKQQEGFISGQRICDELGVSRTAVWKYMNSLKKEGYEIESVTRKGYRLLQSPDLLTREAVLSCIKKGEIPGELCCFESIDSTNEEAKRRGEAGAPDGSIYVADNQTNGKGRRGRTWLSPSGEDIFFTILLRPDLPLNSVSMLTLVAASAVAEAVDKVTGQECQIKWPNDIYVDGKKICGILVETILDPDLKGVIVGIGLNVNNEDFQSMKQITHKEYKISKLAIGLKTFMLIYYNLYQTNQFHKVLEYANSISYLKDQWVEYGDYGEVCFQKLLDDGSVLFVDRQGKTYKQVINEISLHNK